MGGWFLLHHERRNFENKDSMLDYLISLFEDVQDFSRDAAIASHAVLLCRMEQGEVKTYTDTDKIDRIRRANAQRLFAPSSSAVNLKKKTEQKKTKKTISLCHAPIIIFIEEIGNTLTASSIVSSAVCG